MLTIVPFAFACIFSIPMIFLFPGGQTSIGMNGVLSLLYLGVLSTGLAFLLPNASQTLTTSTRTAIILSSESVFGSLACMMLNASAVQVFLIFHDIILKIFKILKTIFQSTASNRCTQQIDTYQKSGGRGSYEWERKQLKCKLRIM
ncbi:EamA family transporter [Caproiciproducens galactitolivorans]|uniref:EamA family transporter n=1 Tax=Caproiciproducens galactitolivorans TaxID=642589 RepID=UPI003AF3811E